MRKCRNERGSIFIFTLLVTMTLSIIALSILPLTVLEYQTSKNFSDFQRAYFIAEAGLEEAVAQLDNNWDYNGSDWKKFKIGEFKIDITEKNNLLIITSIGRIKDIQRTIQANIEIIDHANINIRVVNWKEI